MAASLDGTEPQPRQTLAVGLDGCRSVPSTSQFPPPPRLLWAEEENDEDVWLWEREQRREGCTGPGPLQSEWTGGHLVRAQT